MRGTIGLCFCLEISALKKKKNQPLMEEEIKQKKRGKKRKGENKHLQKVRDR